MNMALPTKRGLAPLLILVLALALLIPSALNAGYSVNVKDIRYRSSGEYTRVVIDLSGSAGFAKGRLKSPDRLYIDLKGSRITTGLDRNIRINDGLVKRIRASQFNGTTVRVVFDLGSVDNYKVFEISNPPRLVVDLFGRAGASVVHRVVLDPGHGGRDPGAMGPGRLKEKDIVLDIAKRVKRILDRQGGYEVHLTRSRDVYLDLDERTTIANKKGADLFVSIHANAHRKRGVRGMETYLLNWTDDEEALKVAARENAISVKRMKQARSELGIILASLELQNKRDESLRLAHYVQRSMVGTISNRYNRVNNLGVKQALFYVLFGAKMPSVLVEVSFITNPEEAKRLSSERYREYLATGIASGIKKYFEIAPPVSKVAMR